MTYEELATPSLKDTSVSLIIPTYQEVENLPVLIERIDQVRRQYQLKMELLIMDDDSHDGTEQYIAQLNQPWIKLVIRKENRGLSPAVVDGLNLAQHDFLIVMDADLSHPPEKIPEMLQILRAGAEFVIGSRYIEGGSTEMGWGLFRWLNSKIATLLAYPFTRVKDPMSGFIALPHTIFERGKWNLNPIGYKIGLELIVKCNCQDVREIPLHFMDRKHGQSKLSLRMQLQYLQHLRRLFIYRYDTWAHFAQFVVVGLSGIFVNLLVLTILLEFDVAIKLAVAIAIIVSMVSNFVLNRRFTFSYARHEPIIKQFFGFCGASSIGAIVNYFTTLFVLVYFPSVYPQVAALVGVLAGTGFNFSINRYLIFKKDNLD
jgi:dolichol-phosphate mannosyltransferase